MNTDDSSRYWLDHVVERAIKAQPEGEIIVSSGISPSGPYHVGHAREILTADAIKRGLEERGRKVRHLHFVDNFDVLRKRYPYLDESYELQVGKPLYLVPAPNNESANYGEQFFSDYQAAASLLGVEMEVLWADKLYRSGKFTEMIMLCLQKRDQIAKILFEVSGRTVDTDWQPIQILDESSQKLNTAKFLSYDKQAASVRYIGSDSKEYVADANKGQIKLDWRLDWPARWALFSVMIEGFGREHATKGGSYDTGKVIAKEIFGIDPPMPIPYDIISLKGESKKMSSSLGNLVTLGESLQIIPPEILRYFTFKSRPDRQLNFDPELGLYILMDEYARTEAETLSGQEPEFKRAWQIANLSGDEHVISTVPFSHMVTVYQTASGDVDTVFELLKRTGHEKAAQSQKAAIKKELGYIKRWLDKFAPEKVRFAIQSEVPKTELAKDKLDFLKILHNKLQSTDMTADNIHNSVYDASVESGLKPSEAFQTIYELFLNKNYGPKVGFFLACLDRDFVLKRLELEK